MNRYMERILRFRALMRAEAIDVAYIPTNDFHNSEYVAEYFKLRAYLTGFTGSAGTLIITSSEACLYTDGRYFLQAEHELLGSGVTLYRLGMSGVDTPEKRLISLLASGGTLGFDGRLLSFHFLQRLRDELSEARVHYRSDFVLPSSFWPDRPALTSAPAYRISTEYTGSSTTEKLAMVRTYMESFLPSAVYRDNQRLYSAKPSTYSADLFLLSALDEIAWLFNLRGNDIPFSPVVQAFSVVTKNEAFLYLLPSAVTDALAASLANEGVNIRNYFDLEGDLAAYSEVSVLLNAQSVSYSLANAFPRGTTLLSSAEPILTRKAVKNATELDNLKKAHRLDGIAVTRFMYWLKQSIGKLEITELSCAQQLLAFRQALPGFIEPSFETISAYNENAAMMHYCATEKSFSVLRPEGFLLVDSGGQYLLGTTDVTRTYALGPVPYEWKLHYTAVLRGMLALTAARFLSGCRGTNLDILARAPLWQMSLDYRCGTGHGVGYFLNVHEAPNGFRWRIVPEREDSCILTEGMVTTNEPGVYVEGSHGIRIENELVCRSTDQNEYGQFLCFDTLTLTPIDLEAVLVDQLTTAEKHTLNTYHQTVYDQLHDALSKEEADWLYKVTRPIG